jgi:hypothetical protein
MCSSPCKAIGFQHLYASLICVQKRFSSAGIKCWNALVYLLMTAIILLEAIIYNSLLWSINYLSKRLNLLVFWVFFLDLINFCREHHLECEFASFPITPLNSITNLHSFPWHTLRCVASANNWEFRTSVGSLHQDIDTVTTFIFLK